MIKNVQKLCTYIFKKKFFIYVSVFFYLIVVFVNYTHNSYDPYKKIDYKIKNSQTDYYTKSENIKKTLKEDISKNLSADETYSFFFNKICKVSGDMHDRHKVRWVKELFLKEFFIFSKRINTNAPYYANILLHSLILFLTFFLINKTFNYNKKYNYLFLLYITFIFQQYIGEYSYSIFETFFLSLALYFSKNKKIFLFFISCLFGILNRESGFIILLTWFIFNNDIKKILLVTLITIIIFLIINIDYINCIINPKFFIPLENQSGQINFSDILKNNFFSNFKLIFVNFLMPFGVIFYFIHHSSKKNKILLLVSLFYLLIFIFAAPAHHVAIRMILLPIIFCAIHFNEVNKKNYFKN